MPFNMSQASIATTGRTACDVLLLYRPPRAGEGVPPLGEKVLICGFYRRKIRLNVCGCSAWNGMIPGEFLELMTKGASLEFVPIACIHFVQSIANARVAPTIDY